MFPTLISNLRDDLIAPTPHGPNPDPNRVNNPVSAYIAAGLKSTMARVSSPALGYSSCILYCLESLPPPSTDNTDDDGTTTIAAAVNREEDNDDNES